MRILKIIGHLLIIAFLSVLTQVGGLIWLLAILISLKFKKKKRFVFTALYLLFNLIIIPPIAKVFGRERLPSFSKELKPRSVIYPLLLRNYVTPELKILLENSANELINSNISITYLDANFPFINGFPLLPHLSHNDGKKIDISFMYLDKDGNSTNKKPSTSGYGAYVNSENKTSENCIRKSYWQYDFPKYLSFGTNYNLKLDERKTKILIKKLLNNPKTQKLFIEPYLKKQLGLNNYSKIRFHGCQAVRHDDHIHLQIK